MPLNEHGQPVGEAVDWAPGPRLGPVTLAGRSCRLEPLEERHVPGLYAALCVESPPSIWTYLTSGPFEDETSFASFVTRLRTSPGMVPLVVLLTDGTADGGAPGNEAGIAAYLRIDHAHGTAEVGHIVYGSALQQTTAATEAMYLMAAHAFDVAGIRRYEWKCDSLNEPSRRAAARLGFTHEGTFRQGLVYKGRNRDTDWFAITDRDWPRLRQGFERWLAPANFDPDGRRRRPLHTEEQP